ncbi:MAG: cobalt-precorrin-5B (C(1))-methyltransferase CbiD [Marinifilaceae bacterium]|jgi:cobalt-precorrin-5B (C1)-methyltransferase|nr:cobalt-precorrin-5B (C(1))-methyltransferase CbiD [Marinifilaceae bacterium]
MNSSKFKKELRTGLTTGTCASAVAKASTYMLINQKMINHVSVDLPSGENVILELHDCYFDKNIARASTIKNAGDDPDITHLAEICASAKFDASDRINIVGGKGIGIVTKAGLAVDMGKPAINPVPMKMITQSIEEILPVDKKVEVCISVPKGEELAKKTFNPQLGIIGGISILGTTGIVKPMSEEALKDSLLVKLRQLKNLGYDKAVFAPGNYGQYFSENSLNIDSNNIVITSNYIGFMLENAVKLGFKTIVFLGYLGKLVKLAGGIFQTHSRTADARNEILASHYMKYSKNAELFDKLMETNTTEEAVGLIEDMAFWKYFVNLIKCRAERFVYNEIEVDFVLLSQAKGILSYTDSAFENIEKINSYE